RSFAIDRHCLGMPRFVQLLTERAQILQRDPLQLLLVLGFLRVLACGQRRVGGTAIRHEKLGPQLDGLLETRQRLARIIEVPIGLAEIVIDIGVVRIALQRFEEQIDCQREITEHAGEHSEQAQGLRMCRIDLQHGAISALGTGEILGLLAAYALGQEGLDPLRRLTHTFGPDYAWSLPNGFTALARPVTRRFIAALCSVSEKLHPMRHYYTPAAARETQGAERQSGKLCLRRRNGAAAIAGVIAPAQIAIRLFLALGVLRADIGATGEQEGTDCREDGGTDHRRISKMPDYSSLRCTK